MNAYESLNEIYDHGQARVDATIPPRLSIGDKAKLRPLVRTFSENVATVVMNYTSQVLNGGHAQWVDNDYLTDDHKNLLAVLALINGPYCQRVAANVKAVLDYCGEDMVMPYDEDEDDNPDDDPLGHLDSDFYKYDKEFCQEVLNWIKFCDVEVAMRLFNKLSKS